ncbi:MAG: hypothetical protein AAF550_05050, partial [Myxococcota bacterium]
MGHVVHAVAFRETPDDDTSSCGPESKYGPEASGGGRDQLTLGLELGCAAVQGRNFSPGQLFVADRFGLGRESTRFEGCFCRNDLLEAHVDQYGSVGNVL